MAERLAQRRLANRDKSGHWVVNIPTPLKGAR